MADTFETGVKYALAVGMLVSVSLPALAQLGIPTIASHMFVLCYDVMAEITPPVCTSAYAAPAIARSNPVGTGIFAFTLGLGKVLALMAFVYAPVLLFVSETGFDLWAFSYTATCCIIGVIPLSAAVAGRWRAPMGALSRWLPAISGLIFVAPSLQADLVAAIIASPVALSQIIARRHLARTAGEAHAGPGHDPRHRHCPHGGRGAPCRSGLTLPY
jgi:TRAP-type uncharacterized transport system fused permease subunit